MDGSGFRMDDGWGSDGWTGETREWIEHVLFGSFWLENAWKVDIF
jgi:hypothetical protein